MSTIAVRYELEKERALLFNRPLLRELDGLVHRDDVHSVRLNTRDLVATSEVLRVRRRALRSRTHTVLVVLANEHARQIPELGLKQNQSKDDIRKRTNTYHVIRFEDLTLVRRTVTVESEGSSLLLEVLLCERNTSTNGHLRADDTITTEEARREDVH